ncbi:MAG: ABC transporter substrate-binding protein [SAR324 cluster bacterium]|nr:ABC transporter substrate-binding protein [SAR324 cluster bacterium]
MNLTKILHQKGVFKLLLWSVLILSQPFLSFGSEKAAATLKIAMLPIIDSFPYYVAQASNDFEKAGVTVKFIPVMSGLNRDQLMQAGEVDGMLNEMTTVANFNRNATQVKVVYTIRTAQADYPMFRLIAGPKSRVKTVADLSGASIGISRNTIIEYVTDRLLSTKGLDSGQTIKKSVPAIPERFQLLMQGQIDAAVLPDPLASAALTAGATLIIDDAAFPQYSSSLFTFSLKTIEENSEALKRFLSVWDQAVARLNADPESYRALMLQKIRVPKNVQKSYPIPRFSRNSVPDRQQWDDVMQWMVKRGLLKKPLSYEQSVTSAFLPGS